MNHPDFEDHRFIVPFVKGISDDFFQGVPKNALFACVGKAISTSLPLVSYKSSSSTEGQSCLCLQDYHLQGWAVLADR